MAAASRLGTAPTTEYMLGCQSRGPVSAFHISAGALEHSQSDRDGGSEHVETANAGRAASRRRHAAWRAGDGGPPGGGGSSSKATGFGDSSKSYRQLLVPCSGWGVYPMALESSPLGHAGYKGEGQQPHRRVLALPSSPPQQGRRGHPRSSSGVGIGVPTHSFCCNAAGCCFELPGAPLQHVQQPPRNRNGLALRAAPPADPPPQARRLPPTALNCAQTCLQWSVQAAGEG